MREETFRVRLKGGSLDGHRRGDAPPDPPHDRTHVGVTIPRCGHFPWLERPGELRRHVERFLAT